MAFPKNNLPVDSLLWGREVERRVDNLETSLTSSQINNSSRDAQLLSNFQRLDVAVADLVVTTTTANDAATAALSAAATAQTAADDAATAAQTALDAIDGLTSLGSTGSTYSINADNITAGTINATNVGVTNLNASNITTGILTGRDVRTSSSGSRVQMTGSQNAIQFFNSSGTVVANMFPGVSGGGTNGFFVSYSSTPDTSANNFLSLTTNGFLLKAGSANSATVSGQAGSLALEASGSGSTISLTSAAGVNIVGGLLSAAADIETSASLRRTALAGGGTTGASINDAGNFQRTTSSARYKTDIRDLVIPYEAVLELQPKLFKRKDEFEAKGDEARDYAGFVAEELAGTDLDVFVAYETLEDGTKRPDGIYYAELTAALVSTLKTQNAMIESLEARLAALENRV